MARLLNLIILSALIVAAAASDAGKGKWYRTAKCLRHSWQKQLDPLLGKFQYYFVTLLLNSMD